MRTSASPPPREEGEAAAGILPRNIGNLRVATDGLAAGACEPITCFAVRTADLLLRGAEKVAMIVYGTHSRFTGLVLATTALLVLSVSGVAHGQPASGSSFAFGESDLALLKQANLLDQRLESQGLIFHDATVDAMLERVGRSVLPDRRLDHVTWRFRVLRDPSENAFALPNGSIYMHAGLLTLLESEDQLASVLAHEAIHVAQRHGYLAHRDYRKKATAFNVFSIVTGLGRSGGGLAAIVWTALGAVVPSILVSTVDGYSRELEAEADLQGFEAMLQAGYDPGAMVQTFQRLQLEFDLQVPRYFYNDHSSAAIAGSEYFHPRLTSRAAPVRTVMVLPVRAEASKVGVRGSEPVLEKSDELAVAITTALKQAFAQHGIAVRKCPFEVTADAGIDPESIGRLADLDARFDQLRPLLLSKPKHIRQGRFSLGDEVADLVPGSDTDVLVVARATAARQTKGLKWLRGDVFDMSRFHSTSIDVTLVDARSGEVLALLRMVTGPSVDDTVMKSVAKLPRG